MNPLEKFGHNFKTLVLGVASVVSAATFVSCDKTTTPGGTEVVNPGGGTTGTVPTVTKVDTAYVKVGSFNSGSNPVRATSDNGLFQHMSSITGVSSNLSPSGRLDVVANENGDYVRYKTTGLAEAKLNNERNQIIGTQPIKGDDGKIIENAIAVDVWPRDAKYFVKKDNKGNETQISVIRYVTNAIDLQSGLFDAVDLPKFAQATNDLGAGKFSNYKDIDTGTIYSEVQAKRITKLQP